MITEKLKKSYKGLGFRQVDIDNWDNKEYWSDLKEWFAPNPKAPILNRKIRTLHENYNNK